MNGIKLKINENSETIKKFSVFKDNITYFTNSYLIFLIVSTFLCVYLAYTGQIILLTQITHRFYTNERSLFMLLGIAVSHGLYFFMRGFSIVKESLIVIKDIGVQFEKKQLNGKKTKKFIDLSKIKDIIIHERLTPYDINYYLFVVQKKADKLVTPFDNFRLRLDMLLKIFYSSRSILQLDSMSSK